MDGEGTYRDSIGAVVDLAVQLDRDRQKSKAPLRERDREIGRDLESLKDSPRKQVLAWLSRVVPEEPDLRFGARVSRALRTGALLLGFAGLVLGWIAAAAVYYYDGSRPVNVVHVLAIFVALQLVLVFLLLLTLLPRSILGRVPVVGALLEVLALLSPGRLQKLVSRYLPEEYRRRTAALLGTSRAHRVLFGSVEKWLIAFSAQVFAVAFNAGALAGCLYLIFFSDLAFSWSTTLQVSVENFHSVTAALAAPWSSLVPEADPSVALIEASRYYRLGEGQLPSVGGGSAAGPGFLGGWWPFLVMSMAFYGLVPRLALWAFTGWRLRVAADHAFLHLPGTADLLDRMNRELVETRARETEFSADPHPSGGGFQPIVPREGMSCVVINWGGSSRTGENLSKWSSAIWGCFGAPVLSAGGANSIARDREVIEEAARSSSAGGVIIFVEGWEPPLEDFIDFLVELRAALAEDSPIAVVPLGADSEADPVPPERRQLEVWRTRLHSLGDPWLSVQPPGGEV